MIRAAATTFQVTQRVGEPSSSFESTIEAVYEPLDTTVTYLEDNGQRIVLITAHIITHTQLLYLEMQRTVKRVLGLPGSAVIVISSHNHCSVRLSDEPQQAFWSEGKRRGPIPLTRTGKQFFKRLAQALRGLPKRAVEVEVSWAVGRERRIAYNCRGRRADGTAYFMREEDRPLLGRDYCGDIDDHAPVVCLRDRSGRPVVLLTHYNAHPATAYHPEHRVVCGEYPQMAGHLLAAHVAREGEAPPVAFLQGCAGDTNSKGLLSGDVALARRFGRYLGQTYIKATGKLRPSRTNRLGLARCVAEVPLAPLPSERTLLTQKRTIEDFVRRARAGHDDTFECIGLNFPRALSPPFRAKLAEFPLRWTNWALRMQRTGKAKTVPRSLPMEVCALRIGDIAIAGLPGEPFISIGRQITGAGIAPLTIACGYTNVSYGYVPDSGSCGEGEYFAAFYLYTTSRPNYRKPAGDVLARAAVSALKGLYRS